ncbi:MAG TPA: hypothetical protein VMT66_07600 [Steroidobacteraceae bacterium]|nr:hypothetical protein [Steroidobacteraceae bacterium]
MIIDERSGSTVAVVRKVGGLISAAWPVRTDETPRQVISQLDLPEDDKAETARRERTIRSLTDGAGASVEHIRRLFVAEFARLGESARVRKFLHVLTTSKIREMLRAASKARQME